MSWRPSASINRLQARSKLLQSIRDFFQQRGVLEVSTPAIAKATASDPCLLSIPLQVAESNYYLQTSPEQHMKRLLAAGSGDIFQICTAFRADEQGSNHNPEFTILEWYRTELNVQQMALECCQLMQAVASAPTATSTISYSQLHINYSGIDPVVACQQEFFSSLPQDTQQAVEGLSYQQMIDYVFAFHIEPSLGTDSLLMVTDFPLWTAALSETRQRQDGFHVSQRFEIYWRGIELANGYQELLDAQQLRDRYQQDCQTRVASGLEPVAYMIALEEAMQHGLPRCSGVALGVDRLFMLASGAHSLAEVTAFPFDRA